MSKNAAPIIVDQRKEALEYIEKHNINKLFEILGSELAQHKPDDPNNFLLLRLQKFKDMKTKDDPVTLFTEKDIDVMFSIFDLTGRGYVTPSQYMKALSAVGVDKPSVPIPTEEKIDRKRFVSNILQEVLSNSY